MRKIKFRAWDKRKNTMIPPFTMWHLLSHYCTEWSYSALEDTPLFQAIRDDMDIVLMQYIGMKDKNGVEIYEGDIVLDNPRHARKRGKGIVEYDNSIYGAGFIIKEISPTLVEYSTPLPEEETYERKFYDEMGKNFSWDGIEVIGNIYENPEMLEDK